jgi:hypothetical protein
MKLEFISYNFFTIYRDHLTSMGKHKMTSEAAIGANEKILNFTTLMNIQH